MGTAGITRGGDVSVRRGRLLLTGADVRVGELDSLTEIKEGGGELFAHFPGANERRVLLQHEEQCPDEDHA